MNATNRLLQLAIPLVILIVIGYIFLAGTLTLFLLSVAFPDYVVFEWDLWRIVALGILELFVTFRAPDTK